MSKVRSTTVAAEGYIKDCDRFPATKDDVWKQAKDGHVYVQIGKDAPKFSLKDRIAEIRRKLCTSPSEKK